ncbi:MAG TPA: CocE/NonD family hydrolase [Galbitalea sp.]
MTRTHGITRRVFRRVFGLSRPATRRIVGELDVGIPMPDGSVLLADRWAPRSLTTDTPTILVRTCYSRKLFWGYVARAYAERGYQTVVVNSRGTFGSTGGPFYAMHHEHDDGLVVLDWVRAQSWYSGAMILAGASYLGYTQWSVAVEASGDVVAMHPHFTSARLAQNFLSTGALELDTAARWAMLTATQERPRANARVALGLDEKHLQQAMNTLPINIIDTEAIGTSWPFYQDTVTRTENDPFWDSWDRRPDVPRVRIPASFLAGWYDPFLVDELKDFAAMRAAGTPARLTIGPWTHASLGASVASVRDTLEWGDIHARGRAAPDRASIRAFVMGGGQWLDLEQWPPASSTPVRWYLGADGALGTERRSGQPSRYAYDPANPTPSVGGRLLLAGAGRKNNRALESRADVLSFTSDPLAADLTIAGNMGAEIWMSSTRPTWDLFVRLCEVDARGRSFNVCDGLIRVAMSTASAEPQLVRLDLSPTAQLFRRGRRIRVQISSGAHPRFARNLGSDERHDTGTAMFVAEQAIFHDAEHPSAIVLPQLG